MIWGSFLVLVITAEYGTVLAQHVMTFANWVLLPLAVAASPVVWQRSSLDGTGTVTVFADDSYSVALQGTEWLVSSPTALHVNGAWYTSGNSTLDDTGSCTISYDVDYRGNDITVRWAARRGSATQRPNDHTTCAVS